MPEYFIVAMFTMVMGWGTFTWRKAESALDKAERVADRTDRLELKIAEQYLTKRDFELQMDRLFGVLSEMKDGMGYLTERVDFHVSEQASETKQLRAELDQYKNH